MPEYDMHHRLDCNLLKRNVDRKEISPFPIPKEIQPITYMFSRKTITSPQIRGCDSILSHIVHLKFIY